MKPRLNADQSRILALILSHAFPMDAELQRGGRMLRPGEAATLAHIHAWFRPPGLRDGETVPVDAGRALGILNGDGQLIEAEYSRALQFITRNLNGRDPDRELLNRWMHGEIDIDGNPL